MSVTLLLAADEPKEKSEPEEQHDVKKAKTDAKSKTTKATPAADPKEPISKSQPKNVVEEGRIYFFYRCAMLLWYFLA